MGDSAWAQYADELRIVNAQMTSQAPLLETHDLAIGYPRRGRAGHTVASGISLNMRPGELIGLLGPNGAGKSTLIRTLCGFQRPLKGKVYLDGRDVHQMRPAERARHLAVVLTERVPGSNLRAEELVALGRVPYARWDGGLNSHDRAIVQWAIEAVRGEALAGRLFFELSDGERQKMLIARALAQDPALIVLDEPTAYLDLPRRVEIMRLLRQLAHQAGRAILLSTHDLDLALRSVDRLWLLPAHGPVQAGMPETLVLEGGLEAAFEAEGMTFDASAGAFRIHNGERGPVAVHGEGLEAIWARRALERIGFEVVADGPVIPTARAEAGTEIVVSLDQSKSPTLWQLHHSGDVRQFGNLEALIEALGA